MSHKKAGGSTQLGRDSAAQRLGVKLHQGQLARPGMIIIRQRGTKFKPGPNVKRAGDDSLYAMAAGKVTFSKHKRRRFDGNLRWATFVSVAPA